VPFDFELLKENRDGTRLGRLETPHGTVETPAFMPVGTQGTVKTLSSSDLEEIGAGIILANMYHLYLRPGADVIEDVGGIHRFMSWNGPVLTDSGGYQVFSLARLNRVTEEGLEFQSHLDGSRHFMSPEQNVALQRDIGATGTHGHSKFLQCSLVVIMRVQPDLQCTQGGKCVSNGIERVSPDMVDIAPAIT